MASVDLFMTILDQNDNKPEFSRESYTVYIDELQTAITPKTIIRVTDNDEGVNSILNFSSARFSYWCSRARERLLVGINMKSHQSLLSNCP